MTSLRACVPPPRAVVVLAVALAACEASGPLQPPPAVPVPDASISIVGFPPRAAVEAAVREHYPEVLRVGPGEVTTVRFFVDASGRVEQHERLAQRVIHRTANSVRTAYPAARRTVDSTAGPGEAGLYERVIHVVEFAAGELGPGEVEVVWDRALSRQEAEAERDRVRRMGPGMRARTVP